MTAPLRLAADNFTPATRTPWGGTRIIDDYKGHLGIVAEGVVGESWEVSVEPSFPSRVVGSERTLADVIAEAPTVWLGSASRYRQCPLLVKLLDAADNLSVQVHPADRDPALAADESGKPEAWVVLAAEPDAGLYLGFRDGVTREAVAACLADGGALDELMTFVPVQAGDAFVIAAGTPHAIGRGVTLLEPQHVAPGRRGLTYRFWDWNRRYDAEGKQCPNGNPRELHVERSLTVTTWKGPRGDDFVAQCRQPPIALSPERARVIDWSWFTTERWFGTAELSVDNTGFAAVTCVAGELTLETDVATIRLRKGESGVIPARAERVGVTLTSADAYITRPAPNDVP